MLKFCVADCDPPLLESVTFTVKLAVPFGPAGIPVICPDESMLSPAGRVPVLTVRVRVPAPPEVAMDWLYAVPSVPAGSEVVVMDGGGMTEMVTEADCEALATEVAVTVAVGSAPTEKVPCAFAPEALAFAGTIAPTAGALYVTEVEVWLDSEPGPLKLHVTPCVPAPLTMMFTLWPLSIACVNPVERVSEAGCEPLLQPKQANTKPRYTHRAVRFIAILFVGVITEECSEILVLERRQNCMWFDFMANIPPQLIEEWTSIPRGPRLQHQLQVWNSLRRKPFFRYEVWEGHQMYQENLRGQGGRSGNVVFSPMN